MKCGTWRGSENIWKLFGKFWGLPFSGPFCRVTVWLAPDVSKG